MILRSVTRCCCVMRSIVMTEVCLAPWGAGLLRLVEALLRGFWLGSFLNFNSACNCVLGLFFFFRSTVGRSATASHFDAGALRLASATALSIAPGLITAGAQEAGLRQNMVAKAESMPSPSTELNAFLKSTFINTAQVSTSAFTAVAQVTGFPNCQQLEWASH